MPCRSKFHTGIVTLILGIAACELLLAHSPLFADSEQVFSGHIVQCSCNGSAASTAAPGHGGNITPCPAPCPNAAGKFLLLDPKSNVAWGFDKDELPKTYANRDVYVIGILRTGTRIIEVNNVIPDVPPQIRRAKTVSIVCDACPRAMGKTRAAAFQRLSSWGRFTILPQPKNADLVLLISANPYLGDYVTRDGPDQRPVHIDIVYMNMIDARTGQSLWGDHQRVGSWFVISATKDLLDELREIVEADVSPVERKALISRDYIYRVATNQGK